MDFFCFFIFRYGMFQYCWSILGVWLNFFYNQFVIVVCKFLKEIGINEYVFILGRFLKLYFIKVFSIYFIIFKIFLGNFMLIIINYCIFIFVFKLQRLDFSKFCQEKLVRYIDKIIEKFIVIWYVFYKLIRYLFCLNQYILLIYGEGILRVEWSWGGVIEL